MSTDTDTLLLIIKAQDDTSDVMARIRDSLSGVEDKITETAADVATAAEIMDRSMIGFSDEMAKVALDTKIAGDQIRDTLVETAATSTVVEDAEKLMGDSLKDGSQGLDDQGESATSWRDKLSNAFSGVSAAYINLTSKIPGLRHATDDSTDSNNKNSKSTESMGDSAKDAESKISELSGKLRMFSVIAAAASAPLTGLLSLGVPALFGAMAVGADKLNTSLKQAEASGTALTGTQKMLLPLSQTLNKAFANLGPALNSTFSSLIKVIQSLGPSLKTASEALGPMIQAIGGGLGQFLTQLIPPLANMLTKMMPVIQALASGLSSLGSGLAGLFTNLNLSAAAQGVTQLFQSVSTILPMLGKFLSAFAPLASAVATTLGPALASLANIFLSVITPVVQKSSGTVTSLGSTFASLAQTIGDVIKAVGPLLTPILQIALAFSNFDTTLEALDPLFASIGKALGPLIALIGQIATLVTNALNTAFTELATAITPVIPLLGQLAGAALTALVGVLQALMPILPAILNALISLLPSVVSLVPVFTDLVVAITPLLVVGAKIITAIIDPLIYSLGKLGPILKIVLVAFLGFLVITKLVGAFQAVMGAFELLQAVMLANPFLALAAAVIAITILIVTHWTAVKAFLTQMWGDIEKVFSVAIDIVVGVVKGWYPVILGILSGGILLIPALIFKYWDQITSFIAKAWNNALAWLAGLDLKILKILKGAGSWLVQTGEDVINGLIKGFENMMGTVEQKIKGFGGDIVNGFKNVLGISSPSRVLADEVGAMIPAGIAKGILSNIGVISNAIGTVGAGTVKASVTHMLSPGTLGSASIGSLGSGGGGSSVYIDLRGSQVMSDRDMQNLTTKLGSVLAKTIAPSGGLRVKM